MRKEKFVNLAVRPSTRSKLRRLARLKMTNLHLAVESLVETELKKILPQNINIDNTAPAKTDQE